MQEFTSISVSSYEADTLTALLNEKSSDGWTVVSIVPTGSTVTAYLSKEASADDSKPATPVGAGAATTAAVHGGATKDADDTNGDDTNGDGEAGQAKPGGGAVDTKPDKPAEPETKSPVDEAPGSAIGAAAGATTTSPAATPATSAAAAPASAAETPAAGAATPAAGAPAAAAPASAAAAGAPAAAAPASAAAAGAPAAAAPASAAAPAGWYADPSSRYELRYWDGSQWTEHVSRSGQQFTDPPVA